MYPKTIKLTNGFTITIERTDDPYAEHDYLGEFVHTEVPTTEAFLKDKYLRSQGTAYYKPMTPYLDTVADLQNYGLSRIQAYRSAIQAIKSDARRLADLENGEWSYLVLVVTIFYNGIEVASTALGGIESDSDDLYLLDTESDLVDEVIRQVESELDAIKDGAEAQADSIGDVTVESLLKEAETKLTS